MHRIRTRRPFVVGLKSSRQIVRRQERSTLWEGVDLAAALQLISDYTDNEAASLPKISNEISNKEY